MVWYIGDKQKTSQIVNSFFTKIRSRIREIEKSRKIIDRVFQIRVGPGCAIPFR